MPSKSGVHPAYREEEVAKAKKSKSESSQSASDSASYNRAATKEAMTDKGESLAQFDKKTGGTGTVSGHAVLRTAGAIRDDLDKAQMHKIGKYAARAASDEDVASGRKKKD